MSLLELRNVVHEYRQGIQSVRALNELSLSFDGGDFVSVIGPSGAGKSTLLHLMGALDTPTSGQVVLDGADLGRLGDDQLADIRRATVGFVFQFFNLLPMLTAWENVAVPRLLDGVRLRQVRPRAEELLRQVGLKDRIGHRPSELSGGQMQRVAIARSLIMDPLLILADEPTGNVDSETGAQIIELLAEIAHDGDDRAVVMVTHNVEAARSTDRTILLVDGALRNDGPPHEVLAKFVGDEYGQRR